MKRSSILATAILSLFSVIAVQACSGDEGGDNDRETPGLNPFTGGTGGAATGTGTGGTAPVATNGGTGNVAEGQGGAPVATNGGTTGTSPANNGGSPAGLGGAPTGLGGAPTGTGGTPPVTGAPPACIEPPAPSNNAACTVTCTDPCSVHALGSRVCTCTNNLYACGTCIFANPNNPLIATPTAPLTPCPVDDSELENQTGCVEPARCESIRLNADMELSRFCACQAGRWDCDSKPSSFP